MVDTVQPRVLASFRNRSALSLLIEDAAAEMEQNPKPQGKTQDSSVTPI